MKSTAIKVLVIVLLCFSTLSYKHTNVIAADGCVIGPFNYPIQENNNCPWIGINNPDAPYVRNWSISDRTDANEKMQDLQNGQYLMPQNEPNHEDEIARNGEQSPEDVARNIEVWVEAAKESGKNVSFIIPSYAHGIGQISEVTLEEQRRVLQKLADDGYLNQANFAMGINAYGDLESVKSMIARQRSLANDFGISEIVVTELGYTTHTAVAEGKMTVGEWVHETAKLSWALQNGEFGDNIVGFTSLLIPGIQIPLYVDPETGEYSFGCTEIETGNVNDPNPPSVNGPMGCTVGDAKWPIPFEELLDYCSKALPGKDSGSCAICEGGEIVIPKGIQLARRFFDINFIVNLRLRDDIFEGQIPDTKNDDKWNKNESHIAYLAGGNPRDSNFWSRENRGIPVPPNVASQFPPGFEQEVPKDLGVDKTTEVALYIEHAADSPAGGSNPPGLSLLDEKWGVTMELDENCAQYNTCYIPRITPVTNKTREQNPGAFPGSDHHVFYTPNDSIDVTPVEFTTGQDAIRQNYEYKTTTMAGSNSVPVYEAVLYNSSGHHAVFVDNNTGREVLTIYNFGNRFVGEDGELKFDHVTYMVSLEECGTYEACIEGLSELPNGTSSSSNGGGPIITAQKELKAAGEVSGTFANNFFSTPQGALSMQGLLGTNINKVYSKGLLSAWEQKTNTDRKNYLSTNLSEAEKFNKVFSDVEKNNQVFAVKDEKSSIIAKAPLKLPSEVANIEKTFNPFGIFSKCPSGLNGPDDSICDNNSVEKPETTIFLTRETSCEGENCSPGSGDVTSKIAVLNHWLSGEIVSDTGGGPVSSYIRGDDLVEKNSRSETYNPHDAGFIQLTNIVIGATLPPGNRLEEINEELALDFEVLPGSSFGGDFKVLEGKYTVPGLGTPTKCANILKGLSVSPENKLEETKVSSAISGCITEIKY